MKKRDFLGASLLAALAPGAAFAAKKKTSHASHSKHPAKPAKSAALTTTLLTVTGEIHRQTRPPFNPALDQLMAKQKVSFERAFSFDYEQLDKLPKQRINPTLEYDGKPHVLSGPTLTAVLHTVRATPPDETMLTLRAIDGYAVSISVAEADKLGFIIATHIDDEPLPLGGLGPLWAVFDADRVPDYAALPLDQRFARCPWGLYHMNVEA